jgi:hypothetical protein
MFATAMLGVTVVCKKSKVECNCGACNHYGDRGGFGMAIHHQLHQCNFSFIREFGRSHRVVVA